MDNPEFAKLGDGVFAEIETSKGTIIAKLEYEKTPMTVSSFVGLAEGTIRNSAKEEGEPYFDGLNFHRVVPDFVIQGGCPQGTGRGGPGYKFPDEFDKTLRHSGKGILSMANSGPGTNGSQFFITLAKTDWLDDKHSVFGNVVSGMSVVEKIKENDKIKSIKIIRNGEKAVQFLPNTDTFKAEIAEAKVKEEEKQKEKFKAQFDFFSKKYPEAIVTDSGLRYVVLKKGTGDATPKMGTKITCHYSGKLIDGSEFDSSYKRGQPLQFNIGQVIEGWNQALVTMKKGEKRILLIPSYLGYGENGYPPVIPQNAALVFEVELIDF